MHTSHNNTHSPPYHLSTVSPLMPESRHQKINKTTSWSPRASFHTSNPSTSSRIDIQPTTVPSAAATAASCIPYTIAITMTTALILSLTLPHQPCRCGATIATTVPAPPYRYGATTAPQSHPAPCHISCTLPSLLYPATSPAPCHPSNVRRSLAIRLY